MEEDRSHMTQRILDLTLEIIYLLTGENYIAFKLSDGLVASNVIRGPIIEPPTHSMRKNNKKVEEVTQKMMELLTGEVPLRCQDVSFSTEEGKPPERCPCPLSSHQDPTQEDLTIPHHHQVTLEVHQIVCKTDVKEEAEDPYVMGDGPCKEEEVPPEISSDTRDHQGQFNAEEEEEGHLRIKEEELFIEIGSDGRQIMSNKEELPIFPEDKSYVALGSPGEDHVTLNFHPTFPRTDPLPDLSRPGDSLLNPSTPVARLAGHEKFLCYVCGKCFTRKESLTLHQRSHAGEKPHSCSVCGKSFLRKWCLINHKRTHTGEKPYSCTECGKHFMHRSNLVFHLRKHSGFPPADPHKPHSCSECGKCFKVNASLLLHQRTHTGVKPYSCSECGKCFAMSSALVKHKRVHTGEKPYSCSECGKSFSQRTHLVLHERTHTGVKPYSCAECEKCFAASSALAKHRRTHTGEKPHSCSVCGRGFTRKENLAVHLKTHSR